MTSPKPPVPSTDFFDSYGHVSAVDVRAIWLAGYHARDTELPRRTPELTERVTVELLSSWAQQRQQFPNRSLLATFSELTRVALDLVFGKERE